MRREDAHVGMLIVFGRPDGEQTLGRVVKLNAVRAKIEALERRAGREVGTIWNVPYHLMRFADEHQAPAT